MPVHPSRLSRIRECCPMPPSSSTPAKRLCEVRRIICIRRRCRMACSSLHMMDFAHLSLAVQLLRIHHFPSPKNMCFLHPPRNKVLCKRRRLHLLQSRAFVFVHWARYHHQLVDRTHWTKAIDGYPRLCCNRTVNNLFPNLHSAGRPEAGQLRRGDPL